MTLSWVEPMNFTAGKVPATETTVFELKPVPFRVSVKLGPPGTAAAGLRLARVSGAVAVL
jgi:hypothetical protein